MSHTELEAALYNKTIETWNQPSEARIKKLTSHLMERLVALDAVELDEVSANSSDYTLAA